MDNSGTYQSGPIDVIILSGQSNMSGRGGVTPKIDGSTGREWDGIMPEECRAEKGSVFRLSEALEWEEAREPLHSDIDKGKVCGTGPGLAFSTFVIRHRRDKGEKSIPKIGLVPCAIGGTSIKEWGKGKLLYEQMLQRTRAALEKGGNLKALLWYQGESDTLSEELASEFGPRLNKFILNLRSDLKSENLPIIHVGITAANHPHPELFSKVRKAQVECKLPGVYYVDAKGLALQEDDIHLTLDAQLELGKMLADSYVENILL